jgi:DNA-binding transcriptional ArsR family regulator
MLNEPSGVSDSDLEQLVSLCSSLSDKTRLMILLALAKGERNVTTLCEELNMSQPAISHHLGLLRMNNLVASRRRGREVLYMFQGTGDAQMPIHFPLQNLTVMISRLKR